MRLCAFLAIPHPVIIAPHDSGRQKHRNIGSRPKLEQREAEIWDRANGVSVSNLLLRDFVEGENLVARGRLGRLYPTGAAPHAIALLCRKEWHEGPSQFCRQISLSAPRLG